MFSKLMFSTTEGVTDPAPSGPPEGGARAPLDDASRYERARGLRRRGVGQVVLGTPHSVKGRAAARAPAACCSERPGVPRARHSNARTGAQRGGQPRSTSASPGVRRGREDTPYAAQRRSRHHDPWRVAPDRKVRDLRTVATPKRLTYWRRGTCCPRRIEVSNKIEQMFDRSTKIAQILAAQRVCAGSSNG